MVVSRKIALIFLALVAFLPLLLGTVQAPVPSYDTANADIFAGLPPLVGDGVTDNAPALAARFAAVATAGGKRVIHLPAGVFLLNEPLSPPLADTMGVEGEGPGTELVAGFGGFPSVTAALLTVNGTRCGFSLKNMTIRGLADNDTACYELVKFNNAVSDIVVENVDFRYSRHAALRCTASVPGRRYRVEGCTFRDHMTANMTHVNGGAMLGLIPESIVSRNQFFRCGSADGSHALYGNSFNTNCIISENVFFADPVQGSSVHTKLHFYDDATTGCIVRGNQFIGGAGTNYTRTYCGGSDLLVTGNRFRYARLQLYTGTNQLVTGNMFTTNGAGGGGIDQGSGQTNTSLVISNNKFSNDGTAANHDFAVKAKSGWTIRDNDFHNLKGVQVAGSNISNVQIYRNSFEYPNAVGAPHGMVRLDSTAGGNHKVHDNHFGSFADLFAIEDNTGLLTNKFWGNLKTDGSNVQTTNCLNQPYLR